MKIAPTPIPGVLTVEAEPQRDARGYFARTFDAAEFAVLGVPFLIQQCSTSYNEKRGTLRGMHYQLPPASERKLVRCTRGAIFDVVMDLRPSSPMFRRWFATELSAANLRGVFVPGSCAHGFLTLTDASEVFYQMDTAFAPELARGVRWNDPAFSVAWPFDPLVIAPRDTEYSDFVP